MEKNDFLLFNEIIYHILETITISRHTLLKHLQNLYRKCGVSSRWDLLKLRP